MYVQRWDDIHTFHYTGMSFDLASGVASFDYLARGATSEYPFTEVVTFPLPERQPDAQTLVVLERVLELLWHCCMGASRRGAGWADASSPCPSIRI